MQVNNISQLLQPKVSQTKASTDNSNVSNSFEAMLQEMMQTTTTGNQDSSNALGLDSNSSTSEMDLINMLNGTTSANSINSAANTGIQSKATSSLTTDGLNSSSLNQQKMAQMYELMQLSSTNNAMASLGSDDSDSDSGDSSDDGLGALGSSNSTGGNDEISQLLQALSQNQSPTASNTNNTNTLDSLVQQLTANMKL
jgi:hypothetical protein